MCTTIKQNYYPKSDSGWSSLIMRIPKRYFVYISENYIQEQKIMLLSYINSLLGRLGNAPCYLSSLDIKSAYYQISSAKDSRKYTALTNEHFIKIWRMPHFRNQSI